MASNSPLSLPVIMQGMADALPTHNKGDDSSDLASSYEAIALLIHAYLAALNFRLCGFDEEKHLAECESLAPRLPPQWNSGFGSLSFVYKHKQSSMRFVIRVDRMGAKVEVRGLAVGDENIRRFERKVRDVVQSSKLPVRIPMTVDGQEDRSGLAEQLHEVFVNDAAVTSLLDDLKVQIVQQLIPKLQVEGYEESPLTQGQADVRAGQQHRDNFGEMPEAARPFQPGPAAPFAPGLPNYPRPEAGPRLPLFGQPRPPPGDFPPPRFEDEYEINRPPHTGGGLIMPGRPPFNIGHDDLNPQGLGPHDPLRGAFTGGVLPQPGGFAGMHPTFDDPLFTGQGGWGGQGGQGGGGQGGYDPQAPPGARWDPIGPGGGPRFPGPGNGRGHPFGGGGGFGGDII